jgi:transposase
MEILAPPVIKEKRPPGRQAKHSVEYMMMVAKKCVDEGLSYREAARTFGVSHGSVYSFIKKYKQQNAKTRRYEKSGRYKKRVDDWAHKNEIASLKQEIGELYLENTMLKKALQLATKTKRESSSVITSENLAQLRGVVK